MQRNGNAERRRRDNRSAEGVERSIVWGGGVPPQRGGAEEGAMPPPQKKKISVELNMVSFGAL